MEENNSRKGKFLRFNFLDGTYQDGIVKGEDADFFYLDSGRAVKKTAIKDYREVNK